MFKKKAKKVIKKAVAKVEEVNDIKVNGDGALSDKPPKGVVTE